MKNKSHDSDDILKRLFEPKPVKFQDSLEELFLQRLENLDIPKTTALGIMGMTTRTLDGIISGEQKMIDYTQLVKMANFLGISLEKVAALYLEKVQKVHPLSSEMTTTGEMVNFVNEKFNLAEFRKVGLIKTLTDYDDIISSICKYFGLSKIFDYQEPDMNIAFSAHKKAKRNTSVMNWVFLAEQMSVELRNPNDYNREKLIEYFPNIRWQSMDVESGLVNVIKHLFQIGITVVFVPSLPSLHVRGATFCVNGKPCIALTDYTRFYPTLWFALIHELYHVLFDWDEILVSNYHISQDNEQDFDTEAPGEQEADNFARKYLFSKEKTREVAAFINNENHVKHFAIVNNVHPSFAYVFYAFDASKDKFAWGRARKQNPDDANTRLTSRLEHQFGSGISFADHVKKIRNTIYN